MLVKKYQNGVLVSTENITSPVDVPATVTMAQARIALSQAGLLSRVQGALEALPDGPEKEAALIAWEYSPNVSRAGALVTSLGAALGLPEEQIDALFIAAGQVVL